VGPIIAVALAATATIMPKPLCDERPLEETLSGAEAAFVAEVVKVKGRDAKSEGLYSVVYSGNFWLLPTKMMVGKSPRRPVRLSYSRTDDLHEVRSLGFIPAPGQRYFVVRRSSGGYSLQTPPCLLADASVLSALGPIG
jgi:hypothetical protein